VSDRVETPEQRPLDSTRTVRLAALTGAEEVGRIDASEDYHEASRVYRETVDPLATGARRLQTNRELRVSATRSVKRYGHLSHVELPGASLGAATLATCLAERRSRRTFDDDPVTLEHLAALLHAGYGVSGALEGTPQLLRTAPSGGALHPLELYVLAGRVAGLDAGTYHYDPFRHVLERLGAGQGDPDRLTPYGDVVAASAAVIAVTAMVWRSRFKYGARAYRFVLLEAGHVAQNVLLAAAALGLAAVPLGGFYDREVDAALGADGLYEASLYLIPVGRRVP
jgi:SagB-type dehydrogenase family enzyme